MDEMIPIKVNEKMKLVRNQQLMDSFMNLTSDGIVVVDVKGQVLDINKKFEELHGWTREEIIGQVLPMTPLEFKEGVLALYQRIIDGEQYTGKESLKLRKDGSSFYADVTISPLKDEDGVVIGFVGVERDITWKKQAEEELKEREERYRVLVECSPEPIVLHSDGIIQFVNETGNKLLKGNRSEDIIGRSIFDFFLPTDYPTMYKRINEIIYKDGFLDFVSYRLLRLDGHILDVEVSSIYIHKHINNPVIQSVIRDMTERKRTEEYVRASEKLSIVGQLAAGIAHEIRNPLTSLKGFVQILKSRNTDYVDIMLEELERINYIVNEFMTIAKPHSVQYKFSELQALVTNVVQFMQPQALLFDVYLKLDLDYSMSPIFCEPNQIKQVIMNIIKNSIESMPAGGEVVISLRQIEGEQALFCIQDQGEGIPEDKLARLGEPFFSMKEKGTGLGLMVCRQIIEAHKGELSIQSQINQGTTVMIKIPCHQSN
jgi:two-component system sporulation sensor kinase A